MNRLSAVLLIGLAVYTPGDCYEKARTECFAFLLRGDVTVSCNGSTSQITHRGDIEGIAVSMEQSSVAFRTSRITKRSGPMATVAFTTTVIDLKKMRDKSVEGVEGVVSTCGGLFPVNARGRLSAVRDVMTGEEIAFPPYVRFRCSSDRRTVVGTTKIVGGDLYEGVPPKTKIAVFPSFNVFRFNISPDGSKIAYYNDIHPLCVFSLAGPAQCDDKQAFLADTPSVNDAGEVLVAAGTGHECFYKDMWNFSLQPFPDATERDQCLGIGYWRRGLKSVQIIEPLGRSPQWISPATAKLLIDWSVRRDESLRK